MIRFECDYAEGCAPEILRRLEETNSEQTPGYGEDAFCTRAKESLKKLCCAPEAEVHFLVGGTQTNTTLIAAALRPHQGVIAAESGHIGVHESGAIEATGHKVLTVPEKEGKLSAAQVDAVCTAHWQDRTHEHMVQPAMVYISQPTENGTLYSLKELELLRTVCDRWRLYLYVDGARLGYGLMSMKNDATLTDLAHLADAFYIGGTKQGMLFGEALVLCNRALASDFRYVLKQRGGMLAKGRLLGLQYEVMFRDGLYFRLADRADKLAMRLRGALEEKGYPLLFDSYTNQQYPILPDETVQRLEKSFTFSFWKKTDRTHTAVRFCTSWATAEEAVDALIAAL